MNKKILVSLMICLAVFAGIEGKVKTKVFNLKTAALDDQDSLSVEQLIVKVLPVRGHAVYVALPDGGNILIDTGRKTDSGKLVRLLKKEITEGEKRYGLAGLIGWKPRIDWVILTGQGVDRIGGLERVLSRFKVRKIISYDGLNLKEMVQDKSLDPVLRRLADVILTLKIDESNLKSDEELDLEQVVSPVKLKAIGSKGALSLRLVYSNFSFIFMGDVEEGLQAEMANKYGDAIKSTILYKGKLLAKNLEEKISPNFYARNGDDVTFVTDGRFMSTVPYDYMVK